MLSLPKSNPLYIAIFGSLVFLFSFINASSQTEDILDNYIKQAIDNNLALKQKELDLQQSLSALKEANGLFYPSISIASQYLLAKGGRSIDLPVGDMLNPVYSSLNEILEGMGQPGNFPQISNQKVQFLPNDYHDTKARFILPLVNAEIYYNRKIKKELISVSQAGVNVYKRELIKDIKTAYYHYLQALNIVEAYKSALGLVNETLRVNKKLVENHIAGPEKIYRMEAEQQKVIASLTKAENDANTASSYFNFLLNKPLNSEVETDSVMLNSVGLPPAGNRENQISQREELKQLNSAIKSSGYYIKLKKSWIIPTVTNVTDIGYQGYSYSFDKYQQYMLNTINFSWPIFNGFQHHNQIARAKIEHENLAEQLSQAELQIELQSKTAEQNLETSIKAEEASQASLNSSREYFRIINKEYALGQKTLLDLLDARNQLTSAQINYSISHFETLIRLAELERANADYDLNSLNN